MRKRMKQYRRALAVALLKLHLPRVFAGPAFYAVSGLAPVAGGDGTETVDTDADAKKASEKIAGLRTALVERIKEMTDPGEEDRAEVKKREKEIGEFVDELREFSVAHESDEVKDLKQRIKALEGEPTGDPASVTEPGDPDGKSAAGRRTKQTVWTENYRQKNDPDSNIFWDKRLAAKGDRNASVRLDEYEGQKFEEGSPELKAWATGDLEDVDLVLPEIQEALPFLQAQAKVVQLCRELRVSSPAVEFPRFTSGLDVDHVDDQALTSKPESDPTFDLELARVYTIAGTTQVPNSTLEDFPAARGWISTELGRATGIQEERDVLQGDGVGEPTGILNDGDISGRPFSGSGGRGIIESTFRAIQDVRVDGFTEPTNIVLNPRVWTDIVLSFEANVGYLYGPPQGSGFPEAEPQARLLGLPVTQSAYVSTTYGGGTNESPVIVGNFQDALVLRRSPFRVDVDTSLGFLKNSTWFRGEERMGFLVVRPASFKVVTGVVPSA